MRLKCDRGSRRFQWFDLKRERGQCKRDASTLLLYFVDQSTCQKLILVIRSRFWDWGNFINPNHTGNEWTGWPGLVLTIGELIENWGRGRLEAQCGCPLCPQSSLVLSSTYLLISLRMLSSLPWCTTSKCVVSMVKLYYVLKFEHMSTFGSPIALISLIRPNWAN